MSHSRRSVLKSGLGALAALSSGSLLSSRAAASARSSFQHVIGPTSLSVHPLAHASFVLETPAGVIYNDPVGGSDVYAGMPDADLILITHEHPDHYDVPTLEGLLGENTRLLTNPAVFDMLEGELKERASAIGNGDSTAALGIDIEAIPAYNLTEERLKYHPQGRDNGYVLDIDGVRVYIAGDTEATPEMRALKDISIAFVPMNLPYTMDVVQAAYGVRDFAPSIVYPYHYRGSDVDLFGKIVAEEGKATQVLYGSWYS